MTTPTPGPADAAFICPRCHSLTSLAAIHCSTCGVNLVIAVAREASQLLSTDVQPEDGVKHLPRLGELLLMNGDVTPARLEMALAHQRANPGRHRTIGEILLEMEAVNREQLDRASLTQMQELHEVLEANRQQLAGLTDRIRYLENVLGEMVKLNQSTTQLLAGLSSELQAPLKQLKTSGVAEDESALQALSDLDDAINQLRRSFVEDEE